MASILGWAVGVGLAFGLAGRGHHWAVRVLCAVAAVLIAASLLIAWLFGGKDAAAGSVLAGMVPAFTIVACVLGLGHGVKAAREHPKAGAGALAIVCVVIAAAWWQSSPMAEAVTAQAAATQAEAATPEAAAPARAGPCACADGALCAGPRGGRYCLTDAGNKRYQQGGK